MVGIEKRNFQNNFFKKEKTNVRKENLKLKKEIVYNSQENETSPKVSYLKARVVTKLAGLRFYGNDS